MYNNMESNKHSIPDLLSFVRVRISEAHGRTHRDHEPRLVAVSKTKPVEMILCAYENGQRHFGENYIQELVEKSQHPLLTDLDIHWHFVGHLQRNKCNSLASVSKLCVVETVDSERLATTLDASWKRKGRNRKLKLFVQVNTSREESKHGCQVFKVPALVKHILGTCTRLEFRGLMTIGQSGHDYSLGPNPDFECLVETRREVCRQLGLSIDSVELSMGMSGDFEEAILAGSTSVRVGTAIFGFREGK